MKRLQVGLLLAVVLAWAAPAQGQFLFNRKSKQNASQRVPELILTLKTEADERKRIHAVEELRDYDAAAFSEIVPVLVDTLQNDKKVNVRLEAVNSLTRIRPIHPLAAPALEKAAQNDESWRVRWQAKTSLPKLNIAGLMSKKVEFGPRQAGEPPLADLGNPNPIVIEPGAALTPVPIPMPPLISVQPSTNSGSGASIPRPLPRGVVVPEPAPPAPRQTAPPPQGPALFP